MGGEAGGEEPITIGLVAHHVFCPRRAWLEAVGERTDTEQMAAGTAAHEATDDASRGRTTVLRAVDVASAELDLVGRCDTLEVGPHGAITIVEYKSTPIRREPTVTDATRVQLALQAICLEEAGRRVEALAVYFINHRVRVPVPLSSQDRVSAREAVSATRQTIGSDTAPLPMEDDPRCASCSHAGICLPQERAEEPVVRRILVADPDAQIVHLSTPGARASVRAGRLVAHARGEEVASLPLERIQGIVVHGNVDLSGALIRELLSRDLTVVWCSGVGRVIGYAVPTSSPNGAIRPLQALAAAHGRLDLAREFVVAKIANQATQLRRNGQAPLAVASLRMYQRRAKVARSVFELLGIEGESAATYFAAFESMLTPRAASLGFRFLGRAIRPAGDAVNACLNYTYALLLGDVVRAVLSCGLDPHAGFLHSSNRNKAALALDLCEEFRAPVADSAVLGAINNGEIQPDDFSAALGSVRLRDRGRRALIEAYERRAEAKFMHPVFRYVVSWRRAMEIQARMVLGVLDGSQPRYVGIKVR